MKTRQNKLYRIIDENISQFSITNEKGKIEIDPVNVKIIVSKIIASIDRLGGENLDMKVGLTEGQKVYFFYSNDGVMELGSGLCHFPYIMGNKIHISFKPDKGNLNVGSMPLDDIWVDKDKFIKHFQAQLDKL